MSEQYVPNNGAWAKALTSYYGKDGVWNEQKIKFIGYKGRWVEVTTSEINNGDGEIIIEGMSTRAGMPHQADLLFTGTFITGDIAPDPAVGSFYKLKTNLSDAFGNFPAMQFSGTGSITYDPKFGAYLNATDTQALETNANNDGFDLLGLMGNGGSKHWEIGGKIKPDSLPGADQKAFVFYSGTETQYIALWYDDVGTLTAEFTNGAYTHALIATNAITALKQTGFVFRHRIDGTSKYLELQTSEQHNLSDLVTPTYWSPTANTPIKFLTGMQPGSEVPADKFFLSTNTHSALVISEDGLELTGTQLAYRNSIPSGWMNPGTGKYYIEILNRTSYDIQFGVTDLLAIDNTQAPGVIGWCVNTINGRKFAKQTGGGTAWTTGTASGSTIGLIYDSDLGIIEVYVNGVKRTNPFANNTITTPVRFIIGGRAETATTLIFNPRVNKDAITWTYTPSAGLNEVPLSSVVTPGEVTYSSGYIADLFIRNAPMSSSGRTLAVITPDLKPQMIFEDVATQTQNVVNENVIKATSSTISATVPDLPAGNYVVKFSVPGYTNSNTRLFTISQFTQRTTELHVDFSKDSLFQVNSKLMAAHKQWGGTNGGVSSEAVKIVNGQCELSALGDQYTGPILGVDTNGQPSGFNTRIGAAVVTKDYFGPASFRVLCKAVQVPGVCNAFWTFHYQEAYAGVPIYDIIVGRGLHTQGDIENGFYVVENNEIDVEFPTALKSNPDQEDVSFLNARFNAWQGELRNTAVPPNDPEYWSEFTDDFINHGINLADDQYHEIRFDWHLGADPRIEYYIDGVLQHTVRTNVPTVPGRFWVGVWFPSDSVQWAGRGAPWSEQKMFVKKIDIIPFADEQQYVHLVSESFPNDVYRNIE